MPPRMRYTGRYAFWGPPLFLNHVGKPAAPDSVSTLLNAGGRQCGREGPAGSIRLATVMTVLTSCYYSLLQTASLA
jgi:hypothetical protein